MAPVTTGVDEVGRGALFGPVFAGAVVLTKVSANDLTLAGLTDSKLLTPNKRAQLIPLIKESAISWSLGQSSAKEIDCYGIRCATEKAMLRALTGLRLPTMPELIKVDGIVPISLWTGKQITIKKGDRICPAIAAASVLAKEARDALIKRLSYTYPSYGLEKHVGYGTKVHIAAIKSLGSAALHRKSFLKKVLT